MPTSLSKRTGSHLKNLLVAREIDIRFVSLLLGCLLNSEVDVSDCIRSIVSLGCPVPEYDLNNIENEFIEIKGHEMAMSRFVSLLSEAPEGQEVLLGGVRDEVESLRAVAKRVSAVVERELQKAQYYQCSNRKIYYSNPARYVFSILDSCLVVAGVVSTIVAGPSGIIAGPILAGTGQAFSKANDFLARQKEKRSERIQQLQGYALTAEVQLSATRAMAEIVGATPEETDPAEVVEGCGSVEGSGCYSPFPGPGGAFLRSTSSGTLLAEQAVDAAKAREMAVALGNQLARVDDKCRIIKRQPGTSEQTK